MASLWQDRRRFDATLAAPMRRREVIALIGGAAALPLAARAQKPVPVIGYLGSESPELFASRLRAFRQGLSAAGYDEGRNVTIEYRWAEGHNDRLRGLAAELVGHNVAVIVAPGSLASALAAKEATATIPIVFECGADPVALGLVASLNRPGGNVTGATSLNTEVARKRLEFLHELVPSATSFGLLVNPTNPRGAEATTNELQAAARALALQVRVLNASTETDFDQALTALIEQRAGGLVIASDIFFDGHSAELARLTLLHRLPAVHQVREFPAAGGLMSYGGSFSQSHSQAGVYVGRILRGEKPADLPVQQVTKVELVINLKTAKALGITVPLDIVGRADELIE